MSMDIVDPAVSIVYANTVKFPSHLEYARHVGVRRMTVDSEEELHKIAAIYSDAE